MVKKIAIKDLIGTPEPILELDMGGVVYQVLPPNSLPEVHYMRLLQANLEFSETSEKVQSGVAVIKAQLAKVSGDETVARSLSNRLTLLQAGLIAPARRAIEAMAQMPDDTLAEMPSSVIERLYSEINDAARSTDEAEELEGK